MSRSQTDLDNIRWEVTVAYLRAYKVYREAMDFLGPLDNETAQAWHYLMQAQDHYTKIAKRKIGRGN